MISERVKAFILLTDSLLYGHRDRLVGLAAANRLPAMYFFRELSKMGGLMSYVPNRPPYSGAPRTTWTRY